MMLSTSATSPGQPIDNGSDPVASKLVAASSLGTAEAHMFADRTPDAATAAILDHVNGVENATSVVGPTQDPAMGTSLDIPQARALRYRVPDATAAAILARVEETEQTADLSASADRSHAQPSTRLDLQPAIEVAAWHSRALDLLDNGSPGAAVLVFQEALQAHPTSQPLREGLARAQYDSGQYAEARDTFTSLVSTAPRDDYAHFGLGLAAAQLGDRAAAVEHLTWAATLRPDIAHYTTALQAARAASAKKSSEIHSR
jgi:Flp pilus assembly protein TadD